MTAPATQEQRREIARRYIEARAALDRVEALLNGAPPDAPGRADMVAVIALARRGLAGLCNVLLDALGVPR
jgi:uncharacterized protein YfdQ (DUF2303 family)